MALTLAGLAAQRRRLRGRGKLPSTTLAGINPVAPDHMTRSISVVAQFTAQNKAGNKRKRKPGKKKKISTKPVGFKPKASSYKTIIVFTDLSVAEAKDKLHEVTVRLAPNYTLFFEKPSFSKTKVQVTCSCDDFFWTWWVAVDTAHSLSGIKLPDPSSITKRDTRVTDEKKYGSPPGTHPVTGRKGIKRNPLDAPGCCKHILALAQKLVNDGKIVQWR